MLTLAFQIANPKILERLILAAVVAGIGGIVAFSLTVVGTIRSSDRRRDGRRVSAFMFGVMAVVSFGWFAAAMVYGIHIVTVKG